MSTSSWLILAFGLVYAIGWTWLVVVLKRWSKERDAAHELARDLYRRIAELKEAREEQTRGFFLESNPPEEV